MSREKSSATGLTSTSTGDIAVVICNGPSLASVPNKWLDRYPTFGANRVFLKYIPDVLTILDLKMVHNENLQQEAHDAILKTKEVFLSEIANEYIYESSPDRSLPGHATVLRWFNATSPSGDLLPYFSADPTAKGSFLVSGGTVTYGMFQLAFWKGFRKILTVGLNHTFRDPRGDHFVSDYNKEVQIPYERENTTPGEFASEPGNWFWSEELFVAKTDAYFDVARQVFEREGGWIKNCTPDTKCTVFEVDDWRNW